MKSFHVAVGLIVWVLPPGPSRAWGQFSWQQHSDGPFARRSHALASDTARQRIVLFGGSPGRSNETWEWDGSSWTQRSPASSPSPRYGHTLTWDPVRSRVLLFAGTNGPQFSND